MIFFFPFFFCFHFLGHLVSGIEGWFGHVVLVLRLMKLTIALVILALSSCAGLQLGVSTDSDGNLVIGGVIPQPKEEK